MPKLLTIQIPQPCGEDPAGMLPTANGSYCNSCKKEVIDFTLMSDDRVAAFLIRQAGNVCGRFYPDQLNRAIPLPKKQLPWAKYFFTIAIPAFLVSLRSSAQNKLSIPHSSITTMPKDMHKEGTNNIRSRWVKGTVMDEQGKPVEDASIMLINTKVEVITDQNGKFRILVPVAGATISVGSVGFSSTKINIPASGPVNIVIKRDSYALSLASITSVTIAGGVRRQTNMKYEVSKKEITITGRVVDQKAEPVKAASVRVLHSQRGTTTDENGEFKIAIQPGDSAISISGIGFITKEISVPLKQPGNIFLERSVKNLDSVTVKTTGLGIHRDPMMLGGAVTTITTRTISQHKVIAQTKRSNEINIYPNPIHSGAELNISWKDKVQSDQLIEIFSADGRMIQKEIVGVTGKISACSFALKNIPPGFYIFMVTDLKMGEKMSKEFIVE